MISTGKITVTKIVEFEAAHKLPLHQGKCKKLHGHTYKLEVEVTGTVNHEGMIIDFGVLKASIQRHVLEELDHSYLNELMEEPPTAETLVGKIAFNLSLNLYVDVLRVRLWETSNSYAEWRSNAY